MFDANTNHDRSTDMDLHTIEAANFEVMIAEEAILDWLSELETADNDASESEYSEPVRVAN
jgi:hypothetical protein